MTDLYCVVGNPIEHSLSPKLHRIFAEQTQEDLEYIKIQIPKEKFASHMHQLVQEGFLGFNVTLPFKEEAFKWVDTLSEEAKNLGALNTIKIHPNGMTEGFSTDGLGLIHDLEKNLGLILKNKKILILGAGGAAKSVIPSLIKAQCGELIIANRTPEKAIELAQKMDVIGIDLDQIKKIKTSFDLIINASSANLLDKLSDKPEDHSNFLPSYLINEFSLCYDMVYGQELSPFLIWGHSFHAKTSDGLGMLIEQGAESFYLWRGIRPETKGIREKLRKTHQQGF